jgi:hypothetical protein
MERLLGFVRGFGEEWRERRRGEFPCANVGGVGHLHIEERKRR